MASVGEFPVHIPSVQGKVVASFAFVAVAVLLVPAVACSPWVDTFVVDYNRVPLDRVAVQAQAGAFPAFEEAMHWMEVAGMVLPLVEVEGMRAAPLASAVLPQDLTWKIRMHLK